jgi:hypothetical protein
MSQNVQNLNQFKQTPVIGQPDWTVNQNIVPVRIDPAYVGALPLVAGQAFKLLDSAGPVPVVTPVTAATDTAWGVAVHSMKRDTFAAGEYIDLALVGSTLYMQASAAIARGAKVQIDPTGPTVATLTNLATNASLGYTVDKPSAAGSMCRVYVNPLDPNLSAY